jgi:hypothetical protein
MVSAHVVCTDSNPDMASFFGWQGEKRIGHTAIDSNGFDRTQSSGHYANRTHYCVGR